MATSDPRTMLHTSDLSPDDFGILAGKVVSRTGLSGPFQLTSGTIADYVNQTGKPELVWASGTVSLPGCVWIVFPDNTAVKIKVPDPSGAGWCEAVNECVIANLEQGAGTQEKYVIDDLAGPTWQISSVTYGESDTVVDFSADTGTDIITLMGALNDSPNLPAGWQWSISGGELVLSVPYETGVTLVVLAGGLEMVFTEPSIPGTPASSLAGQMAESLAGPMDIVIAQYEALLASYAGQLANTFGVGVSTTEANIQTEFAANNKIEVRWTDANGSNRVSYKDPVNGWYHPHTYIVDSPFLTVYSKSVASSGSFTGDMDFTPTPLPIGAKSVFILFQVSSAAPVDVLVDITVKAGPADSVYTQFQVNRKTGLSGLVSEHLVEVKGMPTYLLGGISANGYVLLSSGSGPILIKAYVKGWSR